MPSSSAARTQAMAASFSTWEPWVIQLPYEISLTRRPLWPRCRWFMALTPHAVVAAGCSHTRTARRSGGVPDAPAPGTQAAKAPRHLLSKHGFIESDEFVLSIHEIGRAHV